MYAIFTRDRLDHCPGCAPSSPDTEPILSGHSGNAEKKDSKALKQANLHPIGYKTNDYAPIYTRMGIKNTFIYFNV